MLSKNFVESLRILDVQSAQRARWLGVHQPKRDMDEAEEARQRAREEVRRMLRERAGFNLH